MTDFTQEQKIKAQLITGLKRQVKLMNDNATLLFQHDPKCQHSKELFGAAKITQSWIDGIT